MPNCAQISVLSLSNKAVVMWKTLWKVCITICIQCLFAVVLRDFHRNDENYLLYSVIFKLEYMWGGVIMLQVYSRCFQGDISQILSVYGQTIALEYKSNNDFIDDLECFLNVKNAKFWTLADSGCVVAAMRTENYEGGYLITCLETAPECRRKGYGHHLVALVIERQPGRYYAHVKKTNQASLSLHRKLGFRIVHDYAKYVDGSVFRSSYTLIKE